MQLMHSQFYIQLNNLKSCFKIMNIFKVLDNFSFTRHIKNKNILPLKTNVVDVVSCYNLTCIMILSKQNEI